MFRVQYRVGHLIDAIHKRATGPQPEWSSDDLDQVYEKVYGTPPPARLAPSELWTWDYLFGFWSKARSQAAGFVVRPGSDRVPPHRIQVHHLQKAEIALRGLDLLPDDQHFVFDSETAGWWTFLDAAWTAVAGPVAPPDPDVQRSNSILGAPDSLEEKLIGRDNSLKAITDKIGPISDTMKTSIVVLHGLGGIGKTRLAVEYAYRNINHYGPIIFVGADTPDTLEENIVETVKSSKFQIKPDVTDYKSARNALAQWLEQHKRWLLILDNVDTDAAAEAVQKLFPLLRGGHVLITARISQWHVESDIAFVEVGALKPEEGKTYLLKSARKRTTILPSDDSDALELATSLGGVPSLLTYAAGYVLHGSISFKAYHDQWNTKRADKNAWWSEEKSKRITGYPTPEAATTWQTSVDILSKTARALFDQLAWYGPERIPRAAFSDQIALNDLAGYSLITFVHGEAFTINSVLQEITRVNLEARQDFSSLSTAAKTLESALGGDKSHLIPHVLSFLHFLRDDRFIDFTEADLLDSMGRIAVLALADAAPDGTGQTRRLATLLSDFYEVDPLVPILRRLVTADGWDELQAELLAANNYVLRYGMAEAIADSWEVPQVIALFETSSELNAFELGGYAMELIFAGDPRLITEHAQCLVKLADHAAYGGRSILGDLFLNLVFREDYKGRPLRELANERFWTPCWDFIRLDVQAIEAAEAFMAQPQTPPSSSDPEVIGTFNMLVGIVEKRDGLLKDPKLGINTKKFLRGFFQLGDDPSQLRFAKEELGALSEATLTEVMRVFFSHPIWSVAEAAATVLSTLVEDDETRRDERLHIIATLLDERDNWRVEFGANEAAFAVRHVDEELFYKSVEDHYDHRICKIRGLCAENLISHMINSSSARRNTLSTRFSKHIAHWVRDPDCWVLEHVFRLFNTLHKRNITLLDLSDERGVPIDPQLLSETSPLLKDMRDWWKGDRETFLRAIERVKLTQ